MNPHLLSSIADLLNQGSSNYTVFLRQYLVNLPSTVSTIQRVRAAIGCEAAIIEAQRVLPAAAVAEVSSAITYTGDSGAGPDPAVLQSRGFADLLSLLLSEMEAESINSGCVEQFAITKGHPAYPVFWDFAFIFTRPSESLVLVGSSSD